MADNPYPGASSFIDRHGKTRWRYRARNVTRALPGEPGDPQFEAHYRAAVEGRERPKASVTAMPGALAPQSIGAAWARLLRSREWQDLAPATRDHASRIMRQWIEAPVADGAAARWRDMPISNLKRSHVRGILDHFGRTPVLRKRFLVAIRRLVAVALDEDWIDSDPTVRLTARVTYTGWRAWTDAEIAAFDARWPHGTPARLVKELALWLGDRRSDIASLRHDQRETRILDLDGERVAVDGYAFTQGKTGRTLFLPASPELDAAIRAMPVKGETVLARRDAKPYSAKSLTGWMADWTKDAGLDKGCTIHGLRKAHGRILAEEGATTRQIMDALGHRSITHAELYSRDAEQVRMAVRANARLAARLRLISSNG